MAHRRGSFRGRGISESQRRKKTWAGFGIAGIPNYGIELRLGVPGAAPLDAVVLAQFSSATSSKFVEGTLIRLRGSVDVPKSTAGDTTTSITVAFGIGFITDEAAAAVSVPNPATPEGASWDGWMFHRTGAQGNLDANSGVVDSKSMRKWNDGQSLVFVAGMSLPSLSTVATVQIVQVFLRGLILLP